MEDIFMSIKEAERLRLMKNHESGIITLQEVARLLSIGYRQTLRLWSSYRKLGAKGLVSRKRNNQNRSLDPSVENQILSLIKDDYLDYNPTLTAEKLEEKHQIKVSKETIRRIKIKNKLHIPKQKREVKAYQRRKRRSCLGELIQIDGSPHDWFEGRGPYCTLLLAVDDATSKLLGARLELQETTEGYFRLMHSYLQEHGKPVCLYTDKYGSFRVNHGRDRSKPTQFARAMKELDIGMIAAHSPQAKGRIERANGVLQDRLVKEFRENNISTIEEANLFLPAFLNKYNERFGKEPASPFNAHHELNHNLDLDRILCSKETRKISKSLEVSYKNKIYQIQAPNRVNRLRGEGVQIIEFKNGDICIEHKGESLDFVKYEEVEAQPKVVDHKELANQSERSSKGRCKPSKDHPWRGRKSA